MIRHPRHRAPKNPELANAQADFTAEGAPAPGKVANGNAVVPPLVATKVGAPIKPPPRRKGPAPAGRHRW